MTTCTVRSWHPLFGRSLAFPKDAGSVTVCLSRQSDLLYCSFYVVSVSLTIAVRLENTTPQ